ncbi:hypothetical protein [Stappia sp. ES.058]|uniref:hypothetical protein n=1 Tax=Stappia sp. ES.058 TaxID=1881061 RepID=UPI00087AC373|nr:hypothetical protein [Stappia sp. ES.058]SDU32617.1 hypothetical protein SAMN05428979_2991 [Stappia sp. ES.058]
MSEKPKGERQAALEEPMTLAEDVESDGGRAGGKMNREVATRDHKKRAFERPAGATRVEGRHERKNG